MAVLIMRPIGLGLTTLVLWVMGACTLAPTVNVPTEDIKEAGKDVSAAVKGGAKDFGEGVAAGGERFRAEIQTAAEGVSKIARSTDDLVVIAKDSPAAFGDAVSERVVRDENIVRTLNSVTSLARSGERLVKAAEQGPALLAAKITDMQAELTKADGFLTVQRDAIVGELKKEREAITQAISQERAAAMKDLDSYTTKALHELSAQLTPIIATLTFGGALLLLVILGLPFAAGYIVGRLTRSKRQPSQV